MSYKTRMLLIVLLLCCQGAIAKPALTHKEIEQLRLKGYSVHVIAPIFSQLVAFSYPKGFNSVYEKTRGRQYIHEWVLAGETTDTWSQMITESGAKGLSSNPNMTPQVFANRMGIGFKKTCPASFSGYGVGRFKVNGFKAFAAVLSCGTVSQGPKQFSESALVIVISGEYDYYTVQWAERGTASATPIKFDKAKWKQRFRRLIPIKLCPVVPGERAPYPSCSRHS